ncbi:MAG TPA: phosphoribosylglycinamide formyltransferase [Candidatus Sulfotelmatobacter sp.]|nr:phosphoribosylglycinamide formyltransferase [Candidatus Sulfotelmatobacter sp.]
MARLKVGVLISGRGSNLAALIAACAEPAFPAEIVLVLSNRPDALGLERARQAGLATAVIDHRGRSREDFEQAVDAALRQAGVELICLAGFMRLLTAGFVARWPDRILNIHPSLLPAFKGLHVHEQALAAGVRISGCTVHVVRAETDAGPIVAQAAVPVLEGDSADSLAMRILAAEHRLYPLALRLFAEGRAVVAGERVRLDGTGPAGPALFSPC